MNPDLLNSAGAHALSANHSGTAEVLALHAALCAELRKFRMAERRTPVRRRR